MNPEELQQLQDSDKLLKEVARLLKVKPNRVISTIKDLLNKEQIVKREIKKIQKLLGP